MAVLHFVYLTSLLLVLLLSVVWVNKEVYSHEGSISPLVSRADPWHSAEVGQIEDDPDDEEDFMDETKVHQDPSLACRCWNTFGDSGLFPETECKCRGPHVTSVPSTLRDEVHRLTLYNCDIKKLGRNDLQNYANTLTDFVLDKAFHLTNIEEGAFHGLVKLQRIYIRRAPLLTILPDGLFRLSLPSLHILLIKQTGLRRFPNLTGLETVNILHTVDLEENQLETIPTNSVRLRVDDFLLSRNALRFIEAYAFNGSQMATLRLKGNRRLRDIDAEAFVGLTTLRRLDLSQTAITSLPVRGLSELEILELIETRSLKEIPSVYNYQSLQEAHLTYPYHCCAFAFPATHDPQEHARHQRFISDMQAKYCNHTPEHDSVLLRTDSESFEEFGIDVSVHNNPDDHKEGIDVEVFYSNPLQTPKNRELFFHAFCGNLTYARREVRCTPQPDAFNPCEDILGATWLRVAAWLVSVASVVGNLAVVLVLVQSSRCPMAVSKFLMVNLALADLCMGLYLFLIVGMDVNTMGVYFNYAIDWQNGIGCQVAGFLTVFATELSVFTLVVITSERWYTITYAINLTRRLRLSTTAKIVAVGWIGSFVMASLPLAGISSFSTTSICLPLENNNLSDTIYLLLLLIINGVAFLFICLCYSHMYKSISGHHQSLASHSDATVAKRMALLVFTNFACWTPIAFFGLTAVAGYPLISVTHSKILLVFFYPLNACTNPYLYALVTKQYRRDFFLLLGRYGFCTERASRYRTTYSFGRSNNNPIRAGSQLESIMQGNQPNSPHSTTAHHMENSNGNRKKLVRNPSAKRIVGSPIRSPKSDREVREYPATELLPLSIPSATNQHKALENVQDGSVVKPPNRLSLVLEVESCNDEGLSSHQTNIEARTTCRPVVGCSSIDSPHPIKHCQIRSKGREKTNDPGLSEFVTAT